MAANRRDRARPWSVYDGQGRRVHELVATEAAVRATLPGALVEAQSGRITLGADRGVPRGAEQGERGADFDAE